MICYHNNMADNSVGSEPNVNKYIMHIVELDWCVGAVHHSYTDRLFQTEFWAVPKNMVSSTFLNAWLG